MKISIALCTFNGKLYLKEQLLSIVNQTRPPDELIICDDHSTDDTVGIIELTRSSIPFPIILCKNPVNLGSSKNFEEAVELCSGDVIVFADQDDIWKPHKLETIAKIFSNNHEIGYVFSNAELVDANLENLGMNLWDSIGFSEKEYQKFIGGKQFEVLLGRNVVTGTAMAFRASLKELILPFSDRWIHDGWIAILSSIAGIIGLPIPEPLVLYRQHQNQQIGEYREDALRKTVLEDIKNSLKVGPDDFDLLASAWQDVVDRIIERFPHLDQNQEKMIGILRRRASHFANRKLIQTASLSQRLKKIIYEVRLHNYQDYSCGWLSVGRDLFFNQRH